MSVVARLESFLGWNDAEFLKGIERSEKRAARFSDKVDKSLTSVFKRDPGQRAENAIGNLISGISSGNATQGIAQFAGAISGFSVVAGVGIGAAIELFDRLYTSVKEVRAAHETLREQMRKPISLLGGLSAEGISEQASQLSGSLNKLREARAGFSHGAVGYLEDFDKSLRGGLFTNSSDPGYGKSGLADAKEESDAQQRLNAILRERGKIELELATAKKTTRGDETQYALTELYFKSRQAEAAVRLEGGKGTGDRLKAIKTTEEDLTDEIVHRGEVREREFNTAEKLLKLQRSNVPEEKKKALAASINLEAINQSLASPDIGVSEKRALTLEKLKGEQELRNQTQNPRNKFAYGTIAARDSENESGFGSLAQRNRDMNDSTVWGSLGYSAMQRGETPQTSTGTPMENIANLLQTLTDLTRQVWATP